MNLNFPERVVLCNGAELPDSLRSQCDGKPIRLEYELRNGSSEPNIKISLMKFIRDVNYLPLRIRDLLEIAAYVFCADRFFFRGARSLIEFHSWSRILHFVIKVRDADFWQKDSTLKALSDALIFMSGDQDYTFTFLPGRPHTAASLFDKEEFLIEPKEESKVVLFSGGIDSLAGIINDLENTKANLYLISHRSHQPSAQ